MANVNSMLGARRIENSLTSARCLVQSVLTWNLPAALVKLFVGQVIPKLAIHHIGHIKRHVNSRLKIDPQSTWSTYPNF